MNKQTCDFVEASEVFKGLPLAWDAFCESNPDCTWVPLDNADCTSQQAKQVKQAIKRLESLGQTYVDLEN